MNRGFTCSRDSALLASAAAAAAAGALLLWAHLGSTLAAHLGRSASVEGDLLGRIAARSDYTSERLASLRAEVGRLRSHLGDAGAWESVGRVFGVRWRSEAGPWVKTGDLATRTGSFSMISPTVADWAKILETIGKLEAIPGAGVVEFQMKAGGGREQGSLDTVRVLVSVRARANGSDSTNP